MAGAAAATWGEVSEQVLTTIYAGSQGAAFDVERRRNAGAVADLIAAGRARRKGFSCSRTSFRVGVKRTTVKWPIYPLSTLSLAAVTKTAAWALVMR